MTRPLSRGYTLVELIVAIGLFAIVMTLATGAYLIMINVNRQTQGLATGIDNLSFVLSSMTTAMRTGSGYCSGGYCTDGSPGSSFSFIDQTGRYVRYGLVGSDIESCVSASAFCTPNTPLTATALTITSLTFLPKGTAKGDGYQPYVTITISGTVSVGPGKTEPFSVESAVVMRGSDI